MVDKERQKRIKCIDELILVAKSKGEYTKDDVMNIGCICCSEQMEEAGYTPTEALKIAIELVKTKDPKHVFRELLKITGFEHEYKDEKENNKNTDNNEDND